MTDPDPLDRSLPDAWKAPEPPPAPQAPPMPATPSIPKRPDETRSSWIIGVILIVLGGLFLLQTLTGFNLDNWWALFILIPAFSSFSNAYRLQRENGRLTAAARGSLMGGLLLTFIAAVFLFSLDFGKYWPVFLIFAGISLLFGAFFPD
jgi:hypothetical protein